MRSYSAVGLENVPLWHERDISNSSAERVVIPDAFLALDYMLDRFTWIVEGLVVHSERMRRNLDASQGLVFSHRLLLALVEAGVARNDAYRLVQRHAMQAWEEECDFRELAAADPEIASRIDERPVQIKNDEARTHEVGSSLRADSGYMPVYSANDVGVSHTFTRTTGNFCALA